MRLMAHQDESQHPEWYADGLRFACTQCGNCCTGPPGYVWFTENELTAMARYVGITEKQFLRKHARRINGRWTLNERRNERGQYDCIFLGRTPEGKSLCHIYPVRPTQCRTWPFWPENLESPETWGRASRGCPGMELGQKGGGEFVPIEAIRIRRDMTEE